MAFNPFHTFRKNQKVLLAAMAIFCMFVFVLQFGRGDPIEKLMGLFGSGRGGFAKGEYVATLNGKKIYQGDLSAVQARRELATGFLINAANDGGVQKILEMSAALPKEGPKQEDQIGQVIAQWARILTTGGLPGSSRAAYAQLDLPRVLGEAARLAADKDKETEAASAYELARALQFQAWIFRPREANQKEFYFGGGQKPADLLDALLWKYQADRLGVTLTENQVIASINYESAGQKIVTKSMADDPFVSRYLQEFNRNRRRQVTPSQLLEALTEEFRLGMAQEAFLNQKSGVRAPPPSFFAGFGTASDPLREVPAALTPREFLDYFRKVRTMLRVALVPVRVEDFVSKVEGTPSESALRELYQTYRADEPTPDRDRPGFKEPRRVRIEYVTAKPTSPYYTEQAKATLLFESGPMRLLPPAGLTGMGGGVLPALAAASAGTYDPVRQEYEFAYEPQGRELLRQVYGVPFETPARQALGPAAAAGAAAGIDGRVAALAALAGAVQREDVVAARSDVAVMTAGLVPSPLAGLALPFLFNYTVQPLDAVRDRLLAKEEEKVAPRILARNLQKVSEELAKLRFKPDDARAYVERSVKEYQLDRHQMAEAKSRFGLPEDAALKPLVEAVATATRKPVDPAEADQLFLGAVGVYDARKYPTDALDTAKEPFVYWRVQDLPAHEKTFEEARPQVEAAWKFEQARPIALREAAKAEAALKASLARNNSPAEFEKVLRGFGKEFELDGIAKLLPVDQPQLGSSGQTFRPYTVPPDKVPYPRPDFVDRLLSLEKPGDSVVLRDRPGATFYVAALLDRNDPTVKVENGKTTIDLKAFRDLYQEATKPNSLWTQDLDEERREYRDRVLRGLRSEATGGNLDAQGNIVLPERVARAEAQADSGE